MRLSKLLGKTLREPPSEAHLSSHKLLARAGYLRGLEAGLFAYLPLGHRALNRLQMLVKRELAPFGGQEIELPQLTDGDQQEALVRVVRREVDSYRQLPALLYQFATRPMAQPRVRAGLFGASERPFVKIHAFGSADPAALQEDVEAVLQRVLAACDVTVVWAEAGTAGSLAFFAHPSGDDELVRCPGCGYAAERSWATTAWPDPPEDAERSPEEIDQYYASLEDELAAVGAVGGYASPIGLDPSKLRVVADPSVRSGKNFVSGANRPDYHIQNVNVPRDFRPGEWVDLAQIEDSDPCPHCGKDLKIEPAFALARSTAPAPCKPEAEYLDTEGRAQPLWLASWQLDLGRLLAAVVEAHHDEYGILWPAPCAPLDVHLVALDLRKEAVAAQAEALYRRLQEGGLAVLYDDREASAGVKFNDADLIGLPLRLTVSKRSVQENAIEAKWRDSSERLKLGDEALAVELDRLRKAG
jgi:prolyl-tRNA synthetase